MVVSAKVRRRKLGLVTTMTGLNLPLSAVCGQIIVCHKKTTNAFITSF